MYKKTPCNTLLRETKQTNIIRKRDVFFFGSQEPMIMFIYVYIFISSVPIWWVVMLKV